MEKVIETETQRLLKQKGLNSPSEIVISLGCVYSAAHDWFSGKREIGKKYLRKLEALEDISNSIDKTNTIIDKKEERTMLALQTLAKTVDILAKIFDDL